MTVSQPVSQDTLNQLPKNKMFGLVDFRFNASFLLIFITFRTLPQYVEKKHCYNSTKFSYFTSGSQLAVTVSS